MSRSGTIGVVLAGLAVVIAATGTAVAVTSTRVTIADPVTPSRMARVDSGNRLTTVGATGSYSSSSLLYQASAGDNFVTKPTTASLAIASVSLSSPSLLIGVPHTELRVALYKVTSSSATTCTPTAYQQLDAWNLAPGDDLDADLAVPLLVRSTAAKPYCLSLYTYVTDGSAYAGTYYPYGTMTWYVAGGTYTGPGAAATPQTPARVRRQSVRHTDR